MKKIVSQIKEHALPIILIIVLSILTLLPIIASPGLPYLDPVTSYLPRAEILAESVENGEFFPLWNPYLMSGSPYLDGTSPLIFSYIGIFVLLGFKPTFAVKLSMIFPLIVAGITMYFLAFYLTNKKVPSFLAGTIFMLGGFMIVKIAEGALNQLAAASVLPIVFLFFIKALKEKTFSSSITAGIFLAVQFWFGPDVKVTLFTLILLFLYVPFEIKLDKKEILKFLTSLLVIFLVFFGLAAMFLLPTKANLDASTRTELPYEESASRKTEIKDFFSTAIDVPVFKRYTLLEEYGRFAGKYKIGIISFALAIFAIFSLWRKKTVLYLIVCALATFLFVTNFASIYYLFWKFVPGFSSFRYLERGYIMWSFAIALLAAYGLNELLERYKKYAEKIGIAIIIAVIISLTVFGRSPADVEMCDMDKLFENNEQYKFLSAQDGIFRIHEYETKGIDWPTDPYSIHHKIEHILGYQQLRDPEYFGIYLGTIRGLSDLGMINVKYLTSLEDINISGFKKIKSFGPLEPISENCPPKENLKSFPTSIYENEKFMPRAWMLDNSVAIFASEERISDATYAIMKSEGFDPKNLVLLWKSEKIEAIEKMNKYDAVIVDPEIINDSSKKILEEYRSLGGKVYPDQIGTENPNFTAIEDKSIEKVGLEKKKITLPRNGWLVLSERYASYPGWEAIQNGKKLKIERANRVLSAVYVEKGEVLFQYNPKPYFYGKMLTISMLIIIACFLIGSYCLKRKIKKS